VLAVSAVLAGLAALTVPGVSSGDLTSRANELQGSINADNGRITAFRGRLSDLEARLSGLETSLATQRALLLRIQGEHTAAQTRLTQLQAALAKDRKALAAQLVSQYESPTPDVVGVVMQANSFSDLLSQVDHMRLIASDNAQILQSVVRDKSEVQVETARLATAEQRQRRVTTAVLIEHDQVDSLRLAVLQQETAAIRDRSQKQIELRSTRHKLAVLAARAAAAARATFGGPSGGVAASGAYGFFPAPGTNYSVGEEPQIAARLDRLGKALGLHLIGLSGYRSPEHSVEVGGFADDPHTRGEASDTPGVEGVPESTLLQFGLTRPFPGAAEADHIQLA
jgi:peptidoglycan hydrolase CwlO-like protein